MHGTQSAPPQQPAPEPEQAGIQNLQLQSYRNYLGYSNNVLTLGDGDSLATNRLANNGGGYIGYSNRLSRARRQIDRMGGIGGVGGGGRYDPSGGYGGNGPVAGGFLNPSFQPGPVYNTGGFMQPIQPPPIFAQHQYPSPQQQQQMAQYPAQLAPPPQLMQGPPPQLQQQSVVGGPQDSAGLQDSGRWPQLPEPQDLGIELSDEEGGGGGGSQVDEDLVGGDGTEADRAAQVDQEEEGEAGDVKDDPKPTRRRKLKKPGTHG